MLKRGSIARGTDAFRRKYVEVFARVEQVLDAAPRNSAFLAAGCSRDVTHCIQPVPLSLASARDHAARIVRPFFFYGHAQSRSSSDNAGFGWLSAFHLPELYENRRQLLRDRSDGGAPFPDDLPAPPRKATNAQFLRALCSAAIKAETNLSLCHLESTPELGPDGPQVVIRRPPDAGVPDRTAAIYLRHLRAIGGRCEPERIEPSGRGRPRRWKSVLIEQHLQLVAEEHQPEEEERIVRLYAERMRKHQDGWTSLDQEAVHSVAERVRQMVEDSMSSDSNGGDDEYGVGGAAGGGSGKAPPATRKGPGPHASAAVAAGLELVRRMIDSGPLRAHEIRDEQARLLELVEDEPVTQRLLFAAARAEALRQAALWSREGWRARRIAAVLCRDMDPAADAATLRRHGLEASACELTRLVGSRFAQRARSGGSALPSPVFVVGAFVAVALLGASAWFSAMKTSMVPLTRHDPQIVHTLSELDRSIDRLREDLGATSPSVNPATAGARKAHPPFLVSAVTEQLHPMERMLADLSGQVSRSEQRIAALQAEVARLHQRVRSNPEAQASAVPLVMQREEERGLPGVHRKLDVLTVTVGEIKVRQAVQQSIEAMSLEVQTARLRSEFDRLYAAAWHAKAENKKLANADAQASLELLRRAQALLDAVRAASEATEGNCEAVRTSLATLDKSLWTAILVHDRRLVPTMMPIDSFRSMRKEVSGAAREGLGRCQIRARRDVAPGRSSSGTGEEPANTLGPPPSGI